MQRIVLVLASALLGFTTLVTVGHKVGVKNLSPFKPKPEFNPATIQTYPAGMQTILDGHHKHWMQLVVFEKEEKLGAHLRDTVNEMGTKINKDVWQDLQCGTVKELYVICNPKMAKMLVCGGQFTEPGYLLHNNHTRYFGKVSKPGPSVSVWLDPIQIYVSDDMPEDKIIVSYWCREERRAHADMPGQWHEEHIGGKFGEKKFFAVIHLNLNGIIRTGND